MLEKPYSSNLHKGSMKPFLFSLQPQLRSPMNLNLKKFSLLGMFFLTIHTVAKLVKTGYKFT